MKCPYAVNRTLRMQTTFNYNAESVETSQETIELNKADFCECLESECGAYDTANKRCNYRGG